MMTDKIIFMTDFISLIKILLFVLSKLAKLQVLFCKIYQIPDFYRFLSLNCLVIGFSKNKNLFCNPLCMKKKTIWLKINIVVYISLIIRQKKKYNNTIKVLIQTSLQSFYLAKYTTIFINKL